MPLNDKQKRFCEEYVVDLNATQAAIRAGYSEQTAYSQGQRLLKNVEVQQTVSELKQEQSKRTEITADYVLNGIKEVVERCVQKEQIMVNGQPTGEYKFEHSGALKGYELLGKHLSLFTDKVDHLTSDGSMKPQQIIIEHVNVKDK